MKNRLNQGACLLAASAFLLTPGAYAQTRSEPPRPNPPGNPSTPNPTQPTNPNQPNQPQNPNQPNNPNQPRPNDPNQPNNPEQPNQPIDPNRPGQIDPNRPGTGEEQTLLNRRQRLFRLQDDQAIGQLNEFGQRLVRFETRMRENNEQMLRRLGQARQLQGDRRFDAMAVLLQDMLQEQALLNQYLADLRMSITGDLGDPNDPNNPLFNPSLDPTRVQSPDRPGTNPAPRGPGETPMNPNNPNPPSNPTTPANPPGGTNPSNPRPQGPPR